MLEKKIAMRNDFAESSQRSFVDDKFIEDLTWNM